MQNGQWVGTVTAPEGDPDMYRFVPPASCGSVDIDLDIARRGMAGRHILLIGDSVMRYQARALIYALHFGEWPMRFRGAVQCITVRY